MGQAKRIEHLLKVNVNILSDRFFDIIVRIRDK